MKSIYQRFVLLIACSVPVAAFAQQNARITGSVRSTENKIVEAATVYLLNAKDSTVQKMAITDKTGLLKLIKLSPAIFF